MSRAGPYAGPVVALIDAGCFSASQLLEGGEAPLIADAAVIEG